MAASDSSTSPEVFPWLKALPLAPEYHPTPAQFLDPISYIFKIEKDASKFGICKIVPPVSPPPKKTILANLNKSLEARNNAAGASASDRTFTSRQQQIGFCPRRGQPVQRPFWQSGERYTYAAFEAKAKAFERGFLRKSTKRSPGSSALEIETMYWKATLDKPFTVEYANDMPGSAFPPIDSNAGCGSDNLAETAWNMRAVSRAKGSLLRFMKEEIPGVTSPMVYVAMLFSWFAWHVEDHDLHSLNYLHSGASKTWYGVPRDAAVAFEEVVRVQGYNGEINPLVTFSKLGEKTTVMSPEVFVRAGVPCCRLVQNAGEFVVTFPRAYHTGFSHGFNCAEAANIATPEWLSLAKDAAIRRASINYPPMVSHFQLLYDLALELCSRIPMSISAEPRSSRLKDKKKGEGETIVKESFVHSVLRNNSLLRDLGKGSPIVLLPKRSSDSSVYSKYCSGLQSRFNFTPPLASCSSRGEMNSSRSLISDDLMIDRKLKDSKVKGFYSMKGKLASLCEGSWVASLHKNRTPSGLNPNLSNISGEAENTVEKDGLSDHRLFSCVTCGILSFACVAIIKPREQAARYLMSADCSFFNDWVANPGVASNVSITSNGDPMRSKKNSIGGWADNETTQDIPVASTNYEVQMQEITNESLIKCATNKSSSALGLLALNYGDISDSDEDLVQEDCTIDNQEPNTTHHPSERNGQRETSSPSLQNGDFCTGNECSNQNINNSSLQNFGLSDDLGSTNSSQLKVSRRCSPDTYDAEATKFCNTVTPKKNENMPLVSICDEDSSRMHVFCLEHAVEIEEQFRKIGGVHIQLLCHPEYPKIVAEAKVVAEELGLDQLWNEITFRDTTKEDEDLIQLALDSEEAMHKNGDWAVKLGINLFYSANLSRSPLYSKQMPYNSVIYSAFGRSSPASLITRLDSCKKSTSRQRKFMVGRWCGRVWMSHQAHPLLVQRDLEDDDEDEEYGEEVMGFSNWEPDGKPLRKSDVARKNLVTKKYLRKRKIKPKCVKKEDCEVSDISLDEGSRLVRRSLRSKKKAKHAEKEDSAGSDDSMEQHKSLVRNKKVVVSEDSLVGFGRGNKQILGSKRAKQRSEDLDSADSLDLDSHRVRVTVPKNFQTKQLEHEDSVSDDLADGDENDCQRSCRKISKSSLAKFMERQDSGSDDFCGNNNNNNNNSVGKRYRKTLKRKQAKSAPDEPVLSSKPNRRSKLTKSTVQVTPRQSKQETGKTSSSEEEEEEEEEKEEEDLDVEPDTRLKKRSLKPQQKSTRAKLSSKKKSENIETGYEEGGEHVCDVEGCAMSFGTKQDLVLHKRNICPVKGCGKKFFSHKYLVRHRRVHVDDRPLRCPWKGCKMSFKWAWARTEHIRVHTGARPYICAEPGCSQTFRFVSDFSRHKRKTGHSVKKGRK